MFSTSSLEINALRRGVCMQHPRKPAQMTHVVESKAYAAWPIAKRVSEAK